MATSIVISAIYTSTLLVLKGQYLFQPYPIWFVFLFFTLFVLSSTTFFIVHLSVLYKGYGFSTKPGYWLHFTFGQRVGTALGRGNYFYLSKNANIFGKLSLFVFVILNAIMAFLSSGMLITFNPSSFGL